MEQHIREQNGMKTTKSIDKMRNEKNRIVENQEKNRTQRFKRMKY